MKVFNVICLTLVIVGAIVWGIIGIFNFNLVMFYSEPAPPFPESSTHSLVSPDCT